MDEELYSSTPESVDDSPILSETMQSSVVERLGVELVEELSHLLEDHFILDALSKITSSKSFHWHRSFSRNKIEALKWLAEFIGVDEDGSDTLQQGYLRHLKTKYPEAIKLTFVRTPSAKKLSKKEKSLKKLLIVDRKLKTYEWEIEPDQLHLDEMIGIGSFGSVYHATLFPSHEEVAVKQLAHDVSEEDSATFIKEIAILSRLDHPNVVGFVGACISGALSLVMEYCSSGNLKVFLQMQHSISWQHKCRMARQAADGISYLHSQTPPIAHRDLKCQNILVTAEGDVKVSDFGLSKTISRTIGNALSRMGTLNWLAPEVLRGEVYQSTAVDVYAFGMVLYEIMMDGKPPYDAWQPLQIVRAIDEGQRPEIPDSCDPRYRVLMENCLSPLPEDRPNFRDICKELESIERIANAITSSSSNTSSPAHTRSSNMNAQQHQLLLQQVGSSPPRRHSPRSGSAGLSSTTSSTASSPQPFAKSSKRNPSAAIPVPSSSMASSTTATAATGGGGGNSGPHSPTLISLLPRNSPSSSAETRSASLKLRPKPMGLNGD